MAIDHEPVRIPQPLDYRELCGSVEQKAAFCDQFVQHLRLRGYVQLEHHTLAGQEVAKVFKLSQQFFSLPDDIKQSAAHPKGAKDNRGWAAVGQENSSAVTGFADKVVNTERLTDLKASFAITENFDQGKDDDVEIPNIWPHESDVPGFHAGMNAFFRTAHDIILRLLGALAVGLDLCEDEFTKHHGNAHHEFRILHYPSVPSSMLRDGRNTRIASHTDFGSMSLLFQDSMGGLEGENLNNPNEYLPLVTPSQDTMLVILGDLMTRWTNRHLRAISHRVTLPAKVSRSLDTVPKRFSFAFFGRPDRNVWVAPIPAFLSPENPPKYEGVYAGDYFRSKEIKLH